jgi:hypothetical protein
MTEPSRPAHGIQCAIEVEGILDSRWIGWFDGLSVVMVPSGDNGRRTTLVADLPDQTALSALLGRVTGLNLRIVSVRLGGPAESK